MSVTGAAELEQGLLLSPRARRRRLLAKRFLRRPLAVAGLVVAVTFVLAAVFAPWVAPYSPDATDFNAILEKPSWDHLLGTDELHAFPFLILAVGLAAILGPSLLNATIALAIAAMPGLIRIARGETLVLREEDYVRAAVANGASDFAILGRHVLPNMGSTLIVQGTI